MKVIKGKNITTRDGLLAELRKEVRRIRSDLELGPWQEDHGMGHSASTESNPENTTALVSNKHMHNEAIEIEAVNTTSTKSLSVFDGIKHMKLE